MRACLCELSPQTHIQSSRTINGRGTGLSKKKQIKNIEHAEFVFQREQLQAATAAERLNKAIATVHEYRDELTEEQYNESLQHFELQRKEIEMFLTDARDKYVSKLKELGDPRINLQTGELM